MLDAVSIPLAARLKNDLNWDGARLSAQAAVHRGKKILWEIDFGFLTDQISLSDTSAYLSYTLAVTQFIKTLWQDFKEHTFGVSFYNGTADFSDRFSWEEKHEALFLESANDRGMKAELCTFGYKLFCADVFAQYLHRLISYLPDELQSFCQFTTHDMSEGEWAMLLSGERFAHFQLIINGALPGHFPTAVCLPSDEYCNEDLIASLNRLFSNLRKDNTPYRVIPEFLLTEKWDGVDLLIVIQHAISPQGKRKLQGFCASGGQVSYISGN